MSDDLIDIEIDGKSLKAPKGAMVIEVADANGIHIPRFCYHSKLSVAANCRMCLVEVEKAPKPLPACATPVMPGMIIHTSSDTAIEAQKSVMEFLLINHPLDCPICDQGGECELQDLAMGFGGDISRFSERKRVVKDKNIGPLIATDMTRCIHCTRCVRFGEEIAGMREMGATGRGEFVEIGTYISKSVDSEMSANIIDLCPVGALTSKPSRYSARAWEIQQHEGIANHDTVGSNLNIHVKNNRIIRVVPDDNDAINEAWISDRDRFSYEGLYAEERLTAPMIKVDGEWQETDWETALNTAVSSIKAVIKDKGAENFGVLSSSQATIEELYLLQKFARGLGVSNIDHRLAQSDFSDQDKAPLFPSLGTTLLNLEKADAILVVGSNIRKEQPLINHRIRKAALSGAKVMFVNATDPELNYDITSFALASPAKMADTLNDAEIKSTLADAENAVVLIGAIAECSEQFAAIRSSAGQLAASTNASFGYLATGANVASAWIAGVLPHRSVAGETLETPGKDASSMITEGLSGYLLFNVEPEYDTCNALATKTALNNADCVVALSGYKSALLNETADVLLPIGLFAETSGTTVNAEGVWQNFIGAVSPSGNARPGWKVLRVMANIANLGGFNYVDSASVRNELADKANEVTVDTMNAWDDSAKAGNSSGLTRIGFTPIYSTDALVRHSNALQHTIDAVSNAYVAINSKLAKKSGLVDGGNAIVTQGDAEATLSVYIDDGIADNCVVIPGSVQGSEGLGANFGTVTLSSAGAGE